MNRIKGTLTVKKIAVAGAVLTLDNRKGVVKCQSALDLPPKKESRSASIFHLING
jgi:hypothetical protein